MTQNSLATQVGSELVNMQNLTRAENNPSPVILEIVAEDPRDVALADAIGRDIVRVLVQEGYVTRPFYTGQRGGFFVEIVTDLSNTAAFMWTHREEIKSEVETINDLITLCGTIVVITKVMTASQKQREKLESLEPLKITITIAGVTTTIEGSDQNSVKETADEIIQRLQILDPNISKKVFTNEKPKITGHVPPRSKHRRK